MNDLFNPKGLNNLVERTISDYGEEIIEKGQQPKTRNFKRSYEYEEKNLSAEFEAETFSHKDSSSFSVPPENIRFNSGNEFTIFKAKFKFPIIMIVLFWIIIGAFVALFITGIVLQTTLESGVVYLIVSLIGTVIFVIVAPIARIAIKRCYLIITNKRVVGVVNFLVASRKFSYRLDEIYNVETTSTLGFHRLVINFSQGNGQHYPVRFSRGIRTIFARGVFRVTNIDNLDEAYEKLTKLLTSIKNDKDLMVDINLNKIEAEQRKAASLETMAKNTSYISELKELKSLLDSGVITKEEFENKKREVLK